MKNASQRDSRNAKREKEQREEESLEKSRAALLLSASFTSCLFNNRGFLFLNLSLLLSRNVKVYTSEEEFKGEREGF